MFASKTCWLSWFRFQSSKYQKFFCVCTRYILQNYFALALGFENNLAFHKNLGKQVLWKRTFLWPVADPEEGPWVRTAPPPPPPPPPPPQPLIFRPNWGPKGRKQMAFWQTAPLSGSGWVPPLEFFSFFLEENQHLSFLAWPDRYHIQSM